MQRGENDALILSWKSNIELKGFMAFDSLGVFGVSCSLVRGGTVGGLLPESGCDSGLGTRGSGLGEAPARRGQSPRCPPARPAPRLGSPPSGCRGRPISRTLSGWWVSKRLPERHQDAGEPHSFMTHVRQPFCPVFRPPPRRISAGNQSLTINTGNKH